MTKFEAADETALLVKNPKAAKAYRKYKEFRKGQPQRVPNPYRLGLPYDRTLVRQDTETDERFD